MRYIWIERHKTTSTHQQLGISWPSSPIDNLPALSTLGCSPGDRTKLRIFQTSQLKQFCSTAKYWVPFGVLKHGWKIDGNPRRKWRVILLLILGDHRTQWKCSIVMLDSWRVMLHFLLGGCHVSLSLTGLAMTMIWGLCRNKFAHVYTALQLFQCGVCCYSENNMWKNAMNKHWGSSYQILNIVEKRTGLTSPTTWSLVDTVISSFPTSSQGKFW